LSINIVPSKATFKSRCFWLFHKGSWGRWQLSLPEVLHGGSFDKEVEEFHTALLEAAANKFERTKETVSPHFLKPWWNELAQSAYQIGMLPRID
jgi:hypothetical protein